MHEKRLSMNWRIDITPLHFQNARFVGSYEWYGTVTLRILQSVIDLSETLLRNNYPKVYMNIIMVYKKNRHSHCLMLR